MEEQGQKRLEELQCLLRATAQAAIEAHIMLARFPELHEFHVIVRTEYRAVDVTIDRNHQVTVNA